MFTPEEKELEQKRRELAALADDLAALELALNDLQVQVQEFQRRYLSELADRYSRLDELRAMLAERRAKHNPADSSLRRLAEDARESARQTADDYQRLLDSAAPGSERAAPTEEMKSLFRHIAVLIHPDYATDERSRLRRTRLMAELNEAYLQRDLARMQAVLAQWQESPEAVPGEGVAADLVRTIRTIAQTKRRIAETEAAISRVRLTEMHGLMQRVREGESVGRNILAELAAKLDKQIRAAQVELASAS